MTGLQFLAAFTGGFFAGAFIAGLVVIGYREYLRLNR